MAKGEFARRLALLRGLRGWTQEELAERLGVTRETVVRWESGRNAATRNKLIGICNVLGVTEAEFWDPHYPTEYADPDGPIEVVEPTPSPYHNVRVDDHAKCNWQVIGRCLVQMAGRKQTTPSGN